jgi:hypothetical protein
MHEPVELIDDDLDIVAGGTGVDLDINIADVDQYIRQVQIGGVLNSQAAANVSDVDQQN